MFVIFNYMAVKIPRAKKKKTLKSRLVLVFGGMAALGVVVFLAVSNWRIYQDRRVIQANIEELHEQIQIMEERRTVLQAGLAATQGEDFQEEKMRDQGYKKPGEEVIAVLQDESSNATNQSEAGAGDSFWTQLWKKLRGTEK